MGLHKEYEDGHYYDYDFSYDGLTDLPHRKEVKRLLEDRLERKRLREEVKDDFDDEFDWGDFEP